MCSNCGKLLNPLITKSLVKPKDGPSESLGYGKNINGTGQSACKLLTSILQLLYQRKEKLQRLNGHRLENAGNIR